MYTKLLSAVVDAFTSQETFEAWTREFSRSSRKFKSEYILYLQSHGRGGDRNNNVNINKEGAKSTSNGKGDHHDDNNTGKFSRFSAIPYLKKICCAAFREVENQSRDTARDLLKKATEQIQFCVENGFLDAESAKGYEYVVRSLDFYSAFKFYGHNWGPKKLKSCLKCLRSFEELDGKNKAAVLAVKLFFVRDVCSDSVDEQIKVCREALKLNDDSSEWYLELYRFLEKKRKIRKSRGGRSTKRSQAGFGKDDEVAAILKALNCTGAERDPEVQALYISCLAQCLREDGCPLTFGSLEFHANEKVAEFVKFNADRIIAMDPANAESNSLMREIFATVLPSKSQDKMFAWVCAKRALVFHPESAASHYQYASICVQLRYFKKAETHALQAFEKDSGCIDAALSILMIHLRNAVLRRQDFEKMFRRLVKSGSLSSSDRARVFFVKGMQQFLMGRSGFAAVSLINAFRSDKEVILQELKAVQETSRRFEWPEQYRGAELVAGLGEFLNARTENWRANQTDEHWAFQEMCNALPQVGGKSSRHGPYRRNQNHMSNGRSNFHYGRQPGIYPFGHHGANGPYNGYGTSYEDYSQQLDDFTNQSWRYPGTYYPTPYWASNFQNPWRSSVNHQQTHEALKQKKNIPESGSTQVKKEPYRKQEILNDDPQSQNKEPSSQTKANPTEPNTKGKSSNVSPRERKNSEMQNLLPPKSFEHLNVASAQEILGLPQTKIPESELNEAYERLVRSNDPLKNRELPTEEFEDKLEKMMEINKAWELLQSRFYYP